MEVLLRFVAFLLKLGGFLFTPFLILFNTHKKVQIPPITNDLLKLPVVDLAEKIRKQEVKICTDCIVCVHMRVCVSIKCVNCKCRNAELIFFYFFLLFRSIFGRTKIKGDIRRGGESIH